MHRIKHRHALIWLLTRNSNKSLGILDEISLINSVCAINGMSTMAIKYLVSFKAK